MTAVTGSPRALEPDRLVLLESGLWAVDAFQPVAAVLDPATGAVRRIVSWAEVPPAPEQEVWPPRRVLAGGDALWVQHRAGGPLARVGAGGVEVVAWTDDLWLAACGPSAAWCSPPPPQQQLVHGTDAGPVFGLHHDRLLRVDREGRCSRVWVHAPVRRVVAGSDALLVQVDVAPSHRRDLGAEVGEVVWDTRWLSLPWDAPVPEVLSVDSHGIPEGEDPARGADGDVWRRFWWHEPGDGAGAYRGPGSPVVAGGLAWHLGWSSQTVQDERGLWRGVVASGHDRAGTLVQRRDLGAGSVLAATAVGDRLVVAVARAPWRPRQGRPAVDLVVVDPVVVDPVAEDVAVLVPGGSIDITAGCWPLVPRPVDADSYAQQVLATNDSLDEYWSGEAGVAPLAAGVSGGRAALVGRWPDTQLQWTFSYAAVPDLVLRRGVPLFDELGRPTPPGTADIQLMEDLDTGALPSAAAARDGVLDV